MGPRGDVLGSDFGRASVSLLDPNPLSIRPVPGLVRQLGRLLVLQRRNFFVHSRAHGPENRCLVSLECNFFILPFSKIIFTN
jgi:hypothetical protein